MGQINTNNYPTVNSLLDADLLIVENATNGTGTTTPKQLRENAIGTDPLQTSAQTVTGAINELKREIDLGAGVACYDVDTITSGYLGQFSGSANLLLLHLTTDGTADATNGYMMMLSYSRPVARFAIGRLVDADGVAYKQDVYADNTIICKISNSGEGTESDPVRVVILGIINAGFMLTPTAVVSDRDIQDGQGNTLSVLAEALTKTASGNPVVITDCAGGKARSLKTVINAIQDLHGYDKPWAGGAGKNKLPMTVASIKALNTAGTWSGNTYTWNGNTFEILTDSANNVLGIKVGGTNNGTPCRFQVCDEGFIGDGSYYLNGSSTEFSGGQTQLYTKYSTTNYAVSYNGADTPFTVSGGYTIGGVYILVDANISFSSPITYRPMIRLSTETDPTFAPYSNICPISGRSSVVVDDTGKNLYNNEVGSSVDSGITYAQNADGTIKAAGTASANSYYNMTNVVFPAGTYAFNGCPSGGADNKYKISLFNVTTQQTIGTGDTGSGNTFTANGTDEYRLFIRVNNGYAFPTGGLLFKPMVRLASITDDTYVPYAHSSATIQLGQTVYGADINWDTGVGTVTDAYTTINDISKLGSIQVSENGNWALYTLTGLRNYDSQICAICDKAKGVSFNQRVVSENVGLDRIYANDTANKLGLRLSNTNNITDRTDFFNYWNGAEVCYKLATPTTIQLTPEQLEMLKGYNRVTIDNGSIELGYIAKIS